MNCTKCKSKIEKGQLYHRTKKGSHHADCTQASRVSRSLSDVSVERLVNRFLSWQLPDSVCSDQCVTQAGLKNRTGTNLLTYIEATQMIEYLLADVR